MRSLRPVMIAHHKDLINLRECLGDPLMHLPFQFVPISPPPESAAPADPSHAPLPKPPGSPLSVSFRDGGFLA